MGHARQGLELRLQDQRDGAPPDEETLRGDSSERFRSRRLRTRSKGLKDLLCLIDGSIVGQPQIEGQVTQVVTGISPLAQIFQPLGQDLRFPAAQACA